MRNFSSYHNNAEISREREKYQNKSFMMQKGLLKFGMLMLIN